MSFVHLHNHTHYSLLDGLSRPSDLVRTAKEHGSPAIAMTDHGVLYGAVEFYKEAKAEGIKPIIGCEMYLTRDRFKKDSSVKKSNHLILLAKNETGYQNLLELVTKAHLEGFYYKPRVDHKLLKSYGEGLIATSSCLIGEIPQAILSKDIDKAKGLIEEYIELFGSDNFFIELQNHPEIDEQIIVNNKLKELAVDMKVPMIATNDCHYAKSEDAHAHDILVCVQTGKTLLDDDRMKYTSDFSIVDPSKIKSAFSDVPEAIENTLRIADMCDLEIKLNQNLLPKFNIPQNAKPIDYLKELCEEGLKKRYDKDRSNDAQKRLDYELDIISSMGFADYFLIVHDFVKFAKEKGIVVGPGRGSAAGSIIAYSLNITTVDPLKYGLLFERFLNPERVSMPDIDIDFADHRRNEVLEYVREKYGQQNVAQIITFGTMTAKAAVRDVGRAMGYPYAEVDKIAKLVPPPVLGKHRPLAESVEQDAGLSSEYKSNPRAKKLLDNATKLEGTIRHAGTHACAVVISEESLTRYTALQYASGKDDTIVTQYSMKPLEEIGLLKMDFLGLRNLSIIEHTLDIIKTRHDKIVDLDEIPMDDEKSYNLLSRGETTGVFQLESGGMKRYLKELKPTQIEDIIAMNALYRPGPMEYIPSYIRGKHNPKTIKYMDPSFEPILSETYGVGVYQEQILEIARVFAGFSLGEADLLRKAVGKKDPKLLADQRQKFVEGAVDEGHKKDFAEKVFDEVVEPFAGYGFNKAHATCYAMIAYQTAYLKAHYPTEFMAALLTADKDNTDRIVIEISECRSMGIEVLPPSINDSLVDFTVVNDDEIRFGLAAIKGVGESTVTKIIEAREEHGHFMSLEDFVKKIPTDIVNKKTIESLAYSGALDEFDARNRIALGTDVISIFAKSQKQSVSDGQTDIFGLMTEPEAENHAMSLDLPDVEPLSRLENLKLEKKYLGLYVSGHPLRGLTRYLSSKVQLCGNLSEKNTGKVCKVGGVINSTKKFPTKSGDYMMYATLEDPTGEIELVVFPRAFKQFSELIAEDKVVMIQGRLEKRRNLQIIVNSVKSVSIESMIENAKDAGTFDLDENPFDYVEEDANGEDPPAESSNTFVINIPEKANPNSLSSLKELLSGNKGDTPVELHFKNGQRIIRKVKLSDGIKLDDKIKSKILTLF